MSTPFFFAMNIFVLSVYLFFLSHIPLLCNMSCIDFIS